MIFTCNNLWMHRRLFWQRWIQSLALGRPSDSFYHLFHVGGFLTQLFTICNSNTWEEPWPPVSSGLWLVVSHIFQVTYMFFAHKGFDYLNFN